MIDAHRLQPSLPRRPMRTPLLSFRPPENGGDSTDTQACFISLNPRPMCDIPLGCFFFTGPWTVTRSSLCVL